MEVKKINCFMPVLIVSYVFLSSLVSLLMVVAINQLGIHIPGWVSYVISEAVIIVIGLIYIAVMGIRCNCFYTCGLYDDTYGAVY